MSIENRLNNLEKQEALLSGQSQFVAIHGEYGEPHEQAIARYEAAGGKIHTGDNVFVVVRGE